MLDFAKKSIMWAFAVVTAVFTFLPEKFFESYEWVSNEMLKRYAWIEQLDAQTVNIIISRVICFLVIWVATGLIYVFCLIIRRRITIKGKNYVIRVEYGDILKKRKCKRVISFDECFTTEIGTAIAEIKPTSICGQYLATHSDLDVQQLITSANITPALGKSKYQNQVRYNSGTIVPNGDDLLLAFVKLDERGKGRFFSRDEYLECLDMLWKELENYYAEHDVCVPILGAGLTSFDDGSGASISQQDLLDMMIRSYRLSSHKIKAPHKLRIVCEYSGC